MVNFTQIPAGRIPIFPVIFLLFLTITEGDGILERILKRLIYFERLFLIIINKIKRLSYILCLIEYLWMPKISVFSFL